MTARPNHEMFGSELSPTSRMTWDPRARLAHPDSQIRLSISVKPKNKQPVSRERQPLIVPARSYSVNPNPQIPPPPSHASPCDSTPCASHQYRAKSKGPVFRSGPFGHGYMGRVGIEPTT